MCSRLNLGTLVLLSLIAALVIELNGQNTDCSDFANGYKLPCYKEIDPWKDTRATIDSLENATEVDEEPLWEKIKGAGENIANIVDVSKSIDEVIKAREAAKRNIKTAEKLAVHAKKASNWLQRGAKALGAFAGATKYLDPIMDIVLLFVPASKSNELKAINSGFAKIEATIYGVSDQVQSIKGSMAWNGVVSKLLEIKSIADQVYEKYELLVNSTDNIGPEIKELPKELKTRVEDLVNAVGNTGNVATSLNYIKDLFLGETASTDKRVLKMYLDAVEGDCSRILPLSSELIATVKRLQRLQYFYEINQEMISPDNDKGYPRMIYEMYKEAVTEYAKCTQNADTSASEKMSLRYGNGESLADIIEDFDRMYEYYTWAIMKEEDGKFALADDSGRKFDIKLSGLSEDEKKKQQLTMFAVKKASKAEVNDAISRVTNVFLSLNDTDLPTIEYYADWSDSILYRNEKLDEVRNILRDGDSTLKSLFDNDMVTMVMFEKDSKNIDLKGWHFKSNMQLKKQTNVYSYVDHSYSIKTTYSQFTLGFLFSFAKDTSSFNCSGNGEKLEMSFEGSYPFCLCDMEYGGANCEISLRRGANSTALSDTVLEFAKLYKVPGLFDFQDDIKKQTEKVMQKIEDNKEQVFKEARGIGFDVQKSKNSILAAQSMMLNDLKKDKARIFKGLAGIEKALDAAFERERNERILSTEQGRNLLIKTVGDANKKVVESLLNRLTGKVIENPYFATLKFHVPVFQEKFEEMIEIGGFAQQYFSEYLEKHEQDFLVSKESAKSAITAKTDSFIMAQMQNNIGSGCTEEYEKLVKLTWREMLEIHFSLTTMQQWNLDYKIRNSKNQEEINYLKRLKEDLMDETKSDTREFNEVIKNKSCPTFSLPDLLGGGCAASVTHPGQSVPMQCSDINKSLILASTRMKITNVDCSSDSKWSVDVTDLKCVTKCNFEGQYYDIGENRTLPSASLGYYWIDEAGNEIWESTCLAKPREKVAGEITPKSAEHSKTYQNHASYAVEHAIDRDFGTQVVTTKNEKGEIWIKLSLNGTYCVQQVLLFGDNSSDPYRRTFTCSNSSEECSCNGIACGSYTVTVSNEGKESNHSADPECRYGDTVKLEYKGNAEHMSTPEIGITGKEVTVEYTITISIGSATWSGAEVAQFVKIKGTEGDTKELPCSLDVIGKDLECKVKSFTYLGDAECVIWRTTAAESVTFNKLKLKSGDFERTVEGVFVLNGDNPKEICFPSGLKLAWSSAEEEDINECETEDFCGFGGTCQNIPGSFNCSCLAGYTVGSDGKCEDANECDVGGEGYSKCLVDRNLGTCKNTVGSYKCGCFVGSYTNKTHEGKECVACDCDQDGTRDSVCDRKNGTCLCRENTEGKKCDRCKIGFTNFLRHCSKCQAGYHGYPNCTRCDCETSGVTANICDPQNGRCKCKSEGVGGKRCDKCLPGFIVWSDGKCEDVDECDIEGEGYSKCLVDRNLGTCKNTVGSYRCSCSLGSYTNETHEGKECVACDCVQDGTKDSVCDKQNGTCLCRENIEGKKCDRCKAGYENFPLHCNQCQTGYHGYPNCKRCDCESAGVTAHICDPQNGRCMCKSEGVGGIRCDTCRAYYKSYPSCYKDIKHGTLSSWGWWSSWVDQTSCGSYDTSYYEVRRTRRRTCDDSTKNIHGTSCRNDRFTDVQLRTYHVCERVTWVDIKLSHHLFAGTGGHLWMGIRQGSITCTTSKPTWNGVSGSGWHTRFGNRGCYATFDKTKPIDLWLYSDSYNNVFLDAIEVKVGSTIKTRYFSSAVEIDHNSNNGWWTCY